MNSRPPVKPPVANEPFKHVIDEYKHAAQTITCTCGWHGSSATIDRGGSEWTAHLLAVRQPDSRAPDKDTEEFAAVEDYRQLSAQLAAPA